jgi:hypothetical protein
MDYYTRAEAERSIEDDSILGQPAFSGTHPALSSGGIAAGSRCVSLCKGKAERVPEMWDGLTAERIVNVLAEGV